MASKCFAENPEPFKREAGVGVTLFASMGKLLMLCTQEGDGRWVEGGLSSTLLGLMHLSECHVSVVIVALHIIDLHREFARDPSKPRRSKPLSYDP